MTSTDISPKDIQTNYPFADILSKDIKINYILLTIIVASFVIMFIAVIIVLILYYEGFQNNPNSKPQKKVYL